MKKVVFIAGGNRGIGLETAKELGAQGYGVVLGVRDASKAEEALGTLPTREWRPTSRRISASSTSS